MKKRFASVLPIFILAVVMVACGGTGSNTSLPAARSVSGEAPSTDLQKQADAALQQPGAPLQISGPATSATPAPIRFTYGQIIGVDNTFSPLDGDTASGGNGDTVDGVPCDNQPIGYHFHAHVSLLFDGKRYAIPDAIGLHNPGPESKGLTYATICYYHIHTHDATGLIHIEAPAKKSFALGELFAVWGQPLSSTNVAGHMGTVKAFVATAHTPGYGQQTGPYRSYTGDLQQLQFVSHQEVVLEVGPTYVYPPNIPAIVFPIYQ